MTKHRAEDDPAKGSTPAVNGLSDENPPSEAGGRARSPPGDGTDYTLKPVGSSYGTPRYALMTHAENFARTIGAQLFGKW